MPKSYTESEREYIKNRLMEEAQKCLKIFGFRKTTVDELVKRVNIPKGSFYLFFKSKELLFYEVLCDYHVELHEDLKTRFEALDEPVSMEQVSEMVFELYKRVEASFMYKFFVNGDIELLMRKLPPEVADEHMKKDDYSIRRLIAMIPGMNEDRAKLFSAAMRAIFLSMLHKHEIGEEVFEDGLRLMIRGVVMQMFEGGWNDKRK